MPNLIDGRAIAEKVYVDLRREIAELKTKGVTPGLAVVLIGDDPASRAYVRSKDKMCRELGLHSLKLELPASTTQTELLNRVEELNADRTFTGSLCNHHRLRISTKRQSFARLIRARMWTDSIQKTSQNLCWMIPAASFRARRWASSAC